MKAKEKPFKLVLEVNEKFIDGDDNIIQFGGVTAMVTPPLDEDYWQFRVKVNDEQAIVGFPKFHTIGIGFAKEDDWNTNTTYNLPIKSIWEHIKHNKHYASIPDKRCIEAIKMVQQAATDFFDAEREAEELIIFQNEPQLKSEVTGQFLTPKEFKKNCKIIQRSYMDTFRNQASGTETKKREFCMLFGSVPNKKGFKYKYVFYHFTREHAVKQFMNVIRRYALTGSTQLPDSRFSSLQIAGQDDIVACEVPTRSFWG